VLNTRNTSRRCDPVGCRHVTDRHRDGSAGGLPTELVHHRGRDLDAVHVHAAFAQGTATRPVPIANSRASPAEPSSARARSAAGRRSARAPRAGTGRPTPRRRHARRPVEDVVRHCVPLPTSLTAVKGRLRRISSAGGPRGHCWTGTPRVRKSRVTASGCGRSSRSVRAASGDLERPAAPALRRVPEPPRVPEVVDLARVGPGRRSASPASISRRAGSSPPPRGSRRATGSRR